MLVYLPGSCGCIRLHGEPVDQDEWKWHVSAMRGLCDAHGGSVPRRCPRGHSGASQAARENGWSMIQTNGRFLLWICAAIRPSIWSVPPAKQCAACAGCSNFSSCSFSSAYSGTQFVARMFAMMGDSAVRSGSRFSHRLPFLTAGLPCGNLVCCNRGSCF